MDPEQDPTFLEDLFGNPESGTFLAWLARDGVWSILIILGALLAWYITRQIIHSKFRSAVSGIESSEAGEDVGGVIRGTDRIIAVWVPGVVYATAAVLGVLFVHGRDIEPALDYLGQVGLDTLEWASSSGLKIIFIIVAGWVLYKLAKRFIPILMLKFIRDGRDAADHAEASRKRAETLTAVFLAAINVLLIIIVVFTVLTEVGVPIGPVLGGVGIAGIAVGFGAQHLVRDVITGTLILLENQYRQGDVVEIAGIAGLVESINLRRTVLRDLEGKVHTIPHGEITTTSNFTKYWSRVVLDVGVAYKENMESVFKILNEIGMELANHPDLGLKVIDPPKVLRLNSFDDSAITIRMLGVCKPLTQWELAGWMRRRIKEVFDEQGIEIPFPHQTVYWGDDQVKLPWDKPAEGEPTGPTAPQRPAEPKPEDFVNPGELTPEQREAMLAEMALAAQSAQEQMRRETDSVTRLPGAGENE